MSGRNIAASENLLRSLAALGVREVAVCAGARNSALVTVLDRARGLRTHAFFEERSAAFFALGRARRDRRPAAVVTTSGTAAAELLPAVIEAFHTGVPLVLVTADRPRRLRGTGAPQAIDQTGLFAKFVETEIDIEAGEPLDVRGWRGAAPLHVNVCFDEPLLDGPVNDIEIAPHAPPTLVAGSDLSARARAFLSRVKAPIAVVGTLASPGERQAVEGFLAETGLLCYLEATSGLRESARLAPLALRSGDHVLTWALKQGHFDSIVRIGGVPTVRIWRDLDEPSAKIEVLSLSPWPFAGLSRGELAQGDLRELRAAGAPAFSRARYEALLARDQAGRAHLEALFEREPRAEPSLVRRLARLVPSESLVYVGNSLPIREWDLAAPFDRAFAVEANRGVNGIDGQLSTFLGLVPERGEGWALVGDLTTLYDLAAPWALRTGDGVRARLVVLNNGGGQIFSRVFKSSLFENPHALSFEGWAQMWGLPYESWTEIPSRWRGSTSAVIELKPDAAATARFWDAYDSFWVWP